MLRPGRYRRGKAQPCELLVQSSRTKDKAVFWRDSHLGPTNEYPTPRTVRSIAGLDGRDVLGGDSFRPPKISSCEQRDLLFQRQSGKLSLRHLSLVGHVKSRKWAF